MDKTEKIKKMIGNTGMNLKAFSEKAGLPYTTLRSILERGVDKASINNILLICKALNIKVEDLEKDCCVEYNPSTHINVKNRIVAEQNLDYCFSNKIPLVGDIACGTPILAEENIEQYYAIDSSIKADFCLKTKGKSMINAGIDENTIVFIKKQEEVENGQIAAVLINEEATLKRIYKTENSIILQSENPEFLPIILTEDIKILGKLVAFTKYL